MNVEFEFFSRLCEMDDRVKPVSIDAKASPTECLDHIKWAQGDAVLTFLLLQNVHGCQMRLKPDHIDRVGEMVVHFAAWAVDKYVQFKCLHLPAQPGFDFADPTSGGISPCERQVHGANHVPRFGRCPSLELYQGFQARADGA